MATTKIYNDQAFKEAAEKLANEDQPANVVIDNSDRDSIWKIKQQTRRFTEFYWPTQQTHWNQYHCRLRSALMDFLNDKTMPYNKCSAPLKAYLEWQLKERSEIKNKAIEWKYSPEQHEKMIKTNANANKKIEELEAKLAATEKKEMVDIGIQCVPETIDMKIQTDEPTRADVCVIGCQTEIIDYGNEYDLAQELCQKYPEIIPYMSRGRKGRRFNLKTMGKVCSIIQDPEDNDKAFKSVQMTFNRKNN